MKKIKLCACVCARACTCVRVQRRPLNCLENYAFCPEEPNIIMNHSREKFSLKQFEIRGLVRSPGFSCVCVCVCVCTCDISAATVG